MAMLHLAVVADVINKVLIRSISGMDLTVLTFEDDIDDKMADTSQQQQEVPEPPQTNGVLDGLTEEEKSKMRPADIDADMREMERRKRVEMMMSSRLFREELERIIETQMKDGAGPSGLLQQISEMMGYQGARFNANVFRNSNCVVPINDIRGVESMGYAKGEKLLRCKLAAVFRLLDLYGWTQGVGGMITARLSQDHEHFLVNPYGLLYHEVTASSLVKVDMQGNIVEQGTTNFGVNIASYQLHSTIHAARPDIKCIVHIATPSVTAISATKSGLLPLGQESIVIGEVSSHHYISGANLDPEEREKLARNFGPINKVMLLTNRGALCCGETIEEAFFNVYNTVLACETQLKLMPLGVDNLTLVSDEARKAIYEASRKTPVPQQTSVAEPSPLAEKLEKRWRIGGTEFEALMRMLDNAGFRTGYIYRQPLIKSEPPRPKNDVEVPPAVSSLGYLLEEEELYKQGLWKGGRKGNDRTRWLNSPNVYQKVEILETGTPDPKKITKWVSDGSPTHSSTPVKIDGALQFVPKNTNPKEFKQLQQQIKDYRRADKISAGPQSHILEGVTWEEAKKMQDATISGTGEQVVLVGAASKGIIQRGFQHNAMVYKTPYAKNPFDAVTDQELDQYKKEIERKTKGDMYDESQSESEALSSFNISRATHESSTAKSPIQSPVSVTSETEEESRDEPKVLRIETKQVPAPSQPEVVLSDERSVEFSVMENSTARREDIKPGQSKAQQRTNIKTVNADFLNEQRRSEMMTRRNVNGRGISGVSRLSSSRSNSSVEDLCSWTGNYPICYLTTARAQELARPSKPLFTEILSASAIKREMKRDFFENYENRLKSSTFAKADNLVIVKNNQNLESGSPCSKFEECENKENLNIENLEKIKKAGARRQLRKEMETEVNEIQYSKSINMDFAEKVNLPVECIMTEMKVYNVKSEQEDNKSSSISPVELNSSKNTTKFNKNIELALKPLKKEIEEVCNTSKHSDKEYENCDNNLCDISKKESSDLNQFSENENDVFNSTESSSNSTLKVFSDNETDPKIDSIKSVSDVNDKEISQIYVNEIEFPVCNYSNGLNNSNSNLENHKVFGKCDNNNLHDNSLIIEINQSNNNIEKPSLNFNKSEEIEYDNYYNEVEFFICNNESDKTVNENNDKDPLNVSLEKRIEDNTNGQFGSNFIQKHDFDKEIIPVNNEESSNPNHSTPSRIDVVEKNPLDVSLRKFLDKENDKEDLASNQSFSTNFLNQENDKEDLASNQSSVQNSNLWLSIDNESEHFVNDNVELSSEYSASRSTELNFTYSDIEGCNEVFSPTSNKVNFFCDENLVMKRVTRRDSIADVLNSINADIRPSSKLTVDSLADTENSMKYNLDSQNMSLIYSLTPPNDIDNSSKNTTIVGDISEDDEDCKSDVNINNDEDVFWYNLPSTPDRKDSLNLNKTTELSETSFFSNISNQGSDILELPSQTYLDIQKSSDEIFHKNMSTSVNQILTELNDAEIFVSAANFVDELIEDVACLYLPRDISKYTKIELNNFIHEKIWALNFTKKLAKDLVTNLPYSANNSINSKVSNNIKEPNSIESLNESCYVIHEIIHHVVDKDSVGKWDPKNNKTITDKKAKESINVELKGLKEDYDASDEKSLKCSTPKSLTPRSKNNSLVTNHNEDHIPNIDNNDKNNEVEENVTSYSKSQQSSDTGTSMNSSPSVESQNFAEQEITSDSTDDTKSDNSKEKQSDTCETLKNPSPVENSISEMSLDSPDIPNNDENEKLIKMISEVIDNDIKSDENAELTDTCQTLNLPVFSEQLQFGILDSSKDFVNDESTKNKVNFCIIEYTKEGNVDFETEMHENFESKSDGDADSDESIKEFMQTFINNQNEIEEKIEHMWKYNEAQLEEIYATERLDQISDFKEDLAMCQEIINQLKDAQEDDITTRPYIEEQSTSFICNNEKVKPQSQCKKIDESCTCCIDTEPLSILENMKNQCLPPISEEPELECQKIEESADASSSCNTLPPIFEELELNSSCDDIKTPEMFHSCQNSISMKSCDDQITNSTYTLSAEESECEKNYSKDVSTNDDTYKSDSIISEEIGSNNQAININVTNGIDVNKNVTGISNENLPHKDNEVVTLEYMTYSYDTKEFLQLEMACSNSSEDSNFSHCEDP